MSTCTEFYELCVLVAHGVICEEPLGNAVGAAVQEPRGRCQTNRFANPCS